MAGYFGYFLQGMAGGINQGMQIKEMRRKREAEDQLKKVKAQFEEQAMSVSKKLDEFKADGIISDDEVSMWNTMFLGLGAELQDRFKSTNDSITKGYSDKIEQDNEWYKDFLESTKNITNTEDLKATFEYFNGFVKTDEAKKKFSAYYSLAEKQLAAQQAVAPETFTSPEGVQEKYPKAGYDYNTSAKGYVPTYQKPAAEPDVMAENKKKLDYAYNTGNANYFNQMAKIIGVDTTFETYKQGYEKPGADGVEKARVTSLPQLEEYRDKALNADSWEDAEKVINDYTEAGYDSTQLGVTKEAWANVKKVDLDSLVSVLNEITAGTPNVKGNTKFSFEINGKVKEQTGEEWYAAVFESYNALIKILEEQGIDVSQYKLLKSPSSIKKAGFWKGAFTGGGVEKGDLPSIYY